MTTRIVTDINGRKHITNEPLLRSSHRETVNNQPEALRLADELEMWTLGEPAAAELRRLHAQRDALLEALKYHQEQTRPIQRSIDAIKAAEENT